MEINKKFYVTTPIYYVTAAPHLGTLYSTVLADVAARFYKLQNYKTQFLTGTDEHGQKIAQAAQKAGLEPKKFVDSFIDAYKNLWHEYEIDYTIFMRTTADFHVKAVQQWISQLIESGDIYKAYYSGFYCTPCETYLTEKELENKNKDETPSCIGCGRVTSYVSEESYFFKLSAYANRLIDFYESNPDFITPQERMAEVVSFVKSGLKDLSISRTTVSWGIPFPNDDKHITYVWADALNNYITAIGWGDKNKSKDFNFWWPANMHVMGKDIIRFHAVYWPAFLMASDLALPKKLLVHGWIKVNNQKMSKSFGNAIDPKDLLKNFGAEQVRYYLTRHMTVTQDCEFSTGDLETRINSDLANDLGNLLNRMVALAQKREITEIKNVSWEQPEIQLRQNFLSMLELYKSDMIQGYFARALGHLWKFISDVNGYFHAQEPWSIKDPARFETIISATCHSLYSIAILAWPVMPKKMELLLESLGHKLDVSIDLINSLKNPWDKLFMLKKIENLFEKIVPKENGPETAQVAQQIPVVENININEFAKVMLLVGTIESCDELPKSDKLYKLSVNFGEFGVRQILSGVRKHFACADLISKQAVFVYNLEPRAMMGLESQGMLLTAQDEQNQLKLVTIETTVPNGTRLK